jgi:hypothetical protein
MRPADHPPVSSGGIGVLLVNLGTPAAPTPRAVRRYLAEFLSDRRVVEIPPLAWQPILRGIVLNTRPKKSAHAYSQVWTEQGSPLAAITAQQARLLQERLGKGVRVAHAMRYGRPAIAAELTSVAGTVAGASIGGARRDPSLGIGATGPGVEWAELSFLLRELLTNLSWDVTKAATNLDLVLQDLQAHEDRITQEIEKVLADLDAGNPTVPWN